MLLYRMFRRRLGRKLGRHGKIEYRVSGRQDVRGGGSIGRDTCRKHLTDIVGSMKFA